MVEKKKANVPAKKGTGTSLSTEALDLMAQHQGAGFEKTDADDVLMPRLSILQDLSPQVNPRKPEHVEGAEPGMIINAATNDLYDSVRIIPVFYERRYIEWLPKRGGFVKDHGTDGSIMDQTTKNEDGFDVLPNGNIVQPTATWYVILPDLGGTQAIITMTRTQMKPSRQLMSFATSEKIDHPEQGKIDAPLFFRSYELKTLVRDKGDNSWFVWAPERSANILELEEELGEPLVSEAVKFKDLLLRGELKVSSESFADGDDAPSGGGRSAGENDAM